MSIERDIRKASQFRGKALTRAEGDRLYGGAGAADWSVITGKPSLFPPSGHVHSTGDVTGLAEFIMDTVAALLVQGSGVTLAYNDAGDQITISAAGGGGSNPLMGWFV